MSTPIPKGVLRDISQRRVHDDPPLFFWGRGGGGADGGRGRRAGAVYLFDISDPTAPVQIAEFTAPGVTGGANFANSVAVSGNRIIVGAPNMDNGDVPDAGAAFVYDFGGGSCPADWDHSGSVNSADISAFLSSWLDSLNNADLNADFDNSGSVNSADISAFLNQWLADLSGGNC